MWTGAVGYSQPMWARIEGCYRVLRFMFVGHYK
jgi:hypothetical protein